jgi:hypothetical protein
MEGFFSSITFVSVRFPWFKMAPPVIDVPAVMVVPFSTVVKPGMISNGLNPLEVILMSEAPERITTFLLMLKGEDPILIV